MKLTAQQTTPHRDLIARLYTAVDDMDPAAVGAMVAEDVRFQLGNFDPILGKPGFLAANEAFFGTIQGMQHTVTGLWSDAETAICSGDVFYTRKDGTHHSVPFSSILRVQDGVIADYNVYVDVSGL